MYVVPMSNKAEMIHAPGKPFRAPNTTLLTGGSEKL